MENSSIKQYLGYAAAFIFGAITMKIVFSNKNDKEDGDVEKEDK